MKKREFTELIVGSITKDINPLVVEKYISMAYNMYVQNHWQNKRVRSIDMFMKTFKNQAISDANTKPYTTLPASIIDIPRPGSGVMSIETIGEVDVTFVPVTLSQHRVLQPLESYMVSGPIPYFVADNKIWYMHKVGDLEQVNLRLVLKYEAFDPADEIQFPPHSEMAIRDIVWQFLNQIPPEEKVIDNNERTR